jgi:hypothetical protein
MAKNGKLVAICGLTFVKKSNEMKASFINYYDVLELKRDKLTTNKVLDAYLDNKNKVILNSHLSAAERDGRLAILNEALTVIMSRELRLALDRQIEEHKIVTKSEQEKKKQEPAVNRLANVPDRTLFEALIAFKEGRDNHQLNMIPQNEIERELVMNRLYAMHVIKEVINTKKFPKSLKR